MIWRYFLSVEMSAAAGFNDSVGLAVGRSTSSWYRMVGRVCALHDSVTNDCAGHTGKNMHWRVAAMKQPLCLLVGRIIPT